MWSSSYRPKSTNRTFLPPLGRFAKSIKITRVCGCAAMLCAVSHLVPENRFKSRSQECRLAAGSGVNCAAMLRGRNCETSPFLRFGAMDIRKFLGKIYHHLPQPPSTNFAYCSIRPSLYDLLPPDPIIYDIGAKDARARYFEGQPPSARIIC